MVLVVSDPAAGDVREIEDFELDLAFGSDENALKLEARAGEAPAEGHLVFIDGTEYGGVVDEVAYEAGREASGTVLCKGRTWHGILAGKRLLPDSGSGYLAVSGKAGEVLASLISRMGLSGLFSAAVDDTAVSYTFDRFADGYGGLRALAEANGRKVSMRRLGGKVELSLPPVVDYADKVDSDLLDFTLTSVHRCVNHLVCAGTGELENRAVVHFYAARRATSATPRASSASTRYARSTTTATPTRRSSRRRAARSSGSTRPGAASRSTRTRISTSTSATSSQRATTRTAGPSAPPW